MSWCGSLGNGSGKPRKQPPLAAFDCCPAKICRVMGLLRGRDGHRGAKKGYTGGGPGVGCEEVLTRLPGREAFPRAISGTKGVGERCSESGQGQSDGTKALCRSTAKEEIGEVGWVCVESWKAD